MDNYTIAEHFSLLSKLMDIHGENAFKSKSYSNAAFQIDKLLQPLAQMDRATIAAQKGVGDSTAAKVVELLTTGRLAALDKLIASTPAGVLDMLHIKGLGPKKIQTVWKEMEIESIGELLYACNENRLTLYKGFGEKTQQNIKSAIEFYLNHQGQFLYQQAEAMVAQLHMHLAQLLPEDVACIPTGDFRRQDETIDKLEWVIDAPAAVIQTALAKIFAEPISQETHGALHIHPDGWPPLNFYEAGPNPGRTLLLTTGPEAFAQTILQRAGQTHATTEEEWMAAAGTAYVPPMLRHLPQASTSQLPAFSQLIQPADIRGIIHSHSTWSDGTDSVETMARHAIKMGLEYLVISDHSRSAFYANGLSIERIQAQHAEIDLLNQRLAPFRIFKSVECDILNDGSLDYSDDVLASFDLVIASVHSNLKMPQEKAMMRLMGAIQNKYVTILGHMTGRLLLSRNGYPVDHEAIIAACAANHVAIELNAHPRRLDIDWRWIPQAVAQGVMISINPDSHAAEAFTDTRYGVLVAQKGLLMPNQNLSSLSLAGFEEYLARFRRLRGHSG